MVVEVAWEEVDMVYLEGKRELYIASWQSPRQQLSKVEASLSIKEEDPLSLKERMCTCMTNGPCRDLLMH